MKGNDMHLCWILNENKLLHEYKFINFLCKIQVECMYMLWIICKINLFKPLLGYSRIKMLH